MDRKSARGLLALCLFIAASHQAHAQLTSDVVPRERLVPKAEQVQQEMTLFRHRLGPFRLRPMLVLRDTGYDSNVFGTSENEVSDFTATVGAGTRFILPVGPKGYLRGGILPAYTWYSKLADRRFLGGTYDLSALALFNRLSLEGTAEVSKSLASPSSETGALTKQQLDRYGLNGEVDVTGHISIFASGRAEKYQYSSDDVLGDNALPVSQLNRDESAVRAGIRYRVASFLDFGLAAENTRSTFEFRPEENDNSSEAVIFSTHYSRPKVYLDLSGGYRKGKPANDSSFPSYETGTGSYYASYRLSAPIDVQAFGQRRVSYSVFSENPWFYETINGLGLTGRVGSRLSLRAFGQGGTNDYPVLIRNGVTVGGRKDDVFTYGGGFGVRLYRNVGVTVLVSETNYDSNIDAFDRSIFRVQTALTLTGDFF